MQGKALRGQRPRGQESVGSGVCGVRGLRGQGSAGSGIFEVRGLGGQGPKESLV